MKKTFILCLSLLSLLSCSHKSAPSICELLKLEYCNDSKRSLSRSAGASLPSINSAAFSNPAAIALNKGLGIESIHYQGKAQLGIITGTGRIGAAITNSPNAGTFFGNTAIETKNQYRQRAVNFEKFEEDKISLASAFNVFGGQRKKGLSLDIGVIYKYHEELQKSYFGGGTILSFNKFINIGASYYEDVHYINYSGLIENSIDAFGNSTPLIHGINPLNITETEFRVNSYTAGLKFSVLAIDYINFATTSDDPTFSGATVEIYNMSYFYNKWIMSYGRRFESSLKEEYSAKIFTSINNKSDSFMGVQYATDSGFMLGAFINYYLFNDLSFGVTYFL